MENVSPFVNFTEENWQELLLTTAQYDRPASTETLIELSQKLVFEAMELVMRTPDELGDFGKGIVLSTEKLPKEVNLNRLREHVAGEFGDLLWYAGALLAEKDISMSEVLERGLEKMNITPSSSIEKNTLEFFSQEASIRAPESYPSNQELKDNPFVIYGGWYVSRFIRTISPEYVQPETTREDVVDAGADLIWATTYLLKEYCDADLETVLKENYHKLQFRAKTGIPQGQGIGDDHWS